MASFDSNDALHGAALSGVDTYGEETEWAEPGAGEKAGDCGICSLRGVRAERGAGFTNCDGGIVTRGDSGRTLAVLAALAEDAVLLIDELVAEEALES